MKISNAQVYSNEICKITFSFETRFKERRQLFDYSFRNQLNLKIRTLQHTHVNKHRYIILIVQRYCYEIDQVNNCVDKRDVYKK